ALTNTTVKVTFNEEVKKELAEDAKNYTIAGLTVSAAKFESDKKSVVLTTTAQTPGTIYTVLVINVQDISDNVINADKDEFKFGGIAADTTKPSVVSAEATNATTVKVTFSEPVDEVTAKQTFNYNLGSELGFPSSVAKESGTVYVLTTASQKRITYTLDVTGVKDLSGNVLDEDKDEAKLAGNGALDTSAPKVVSAISLNKQEIRIVFDEELSDTGNLNTVSKIDPSDFVFSYVSGAADVAAANTIVGQTPTAVVVADDKRSVTVTFTNSIAANDVRGTAAGAIYRVTVSGVEDAVGNDIATTNNTADFAGINQANSKPSITFAQALDAQTLKLTFSEKIKKTADLVIQNFTFSPAVSFPELVSQVVAKDGLSATFYFKGASFEAGKVYTVQISAAGVANIKDETEMQTLEVKSGQTFAETVFAGNGTAPDAVKITSVVAVNVNTIDITFNKPINKRSIIDNGIIESVTLDNGGTFTAPTVALVRTEGDDGNKLRVFFNDTANKFTAGAIYRVKLVEGQVNNGVVVGKIIDNNDKVMLAADDSGVFAASSAANDRPKMVSAVARPNGNTVEVEFSEALKVTGGTVDGLATGAPWDFLLTASNNATISSVALKADSGNKVVILTLSGAQTANALITVTFVDATPGTANTVVYDEAGVASVDPSVTVQYVAD
ncbi:MAG: Ig-like domain-containing protein, partial [Paenibacillaceae bacterium]|nr:Ig-like domain-containing protein [Paenibacillaceae bacterium]